MRGGPARLALEIRPRHQPAEIGVTGLVGGDQDNAALGEMPAVVVALLDAVGRPLELDHQLGPKQRLHALAGGLLGEFQRAEQIVGVGDTKRRLFVGLGQIEQMPELEGALEQ